jgi:predicted PurR-regulated permease PerM
MAAPRLQNPLTHLVQAADAASKVLSIQAELFVLNQELRTLRQIKRGIWAGIGLLCFALLISFTLYWVQIALHERGWSALSLAMISFIFFGILCGVALYTAIRVGQEPPDNQKNQNIGNDYETHKTH